jgi:hypothetical protein
MLMHAVFALQIISTRLGDVYSWKEQFGRNISSATPLAVTSTIGATAQSKVYGIIRCALLVPGFLLGRITTPCDQSQATQAQ